ncbi:AAA family ATPase [Pseudanabaena sp. Chao 1811]|uniref:AAA family ATPase n=1 Tax=Pseudanabaena sp. Chao 1811 TaxID=2963092 RepID=UPI0022F3FEF7|nr:AAA family ATPase [Pseudanabaena sp. Chao 1811]
MAQLPNMLKDGELYSITLRALINLGGSGTNEQILEQIKLILDVQDNNQKKHIESRFGWVKTHLKKSGLIKNIGWGKWSLTSNYQNSNEDLDQAKIEGQFEKWSLTAKATAMNQFLQDTSITPEELDRYEKTIKRKKQIILAGSPGTGKTFIAQKFAKYLTSTQDGYMDLVQFHPSYTYEDFMRGLKPEIKDGSLTYNYAEGRFIQFCEKAQTEYQDLPCVFIIDEINRANISQVFGELMYLLEYRNAEITLSSGKTFTIPDNVLIIGTMNTADRSIALIDHALRRRFAFIKITPNYQSLRNKFQDSDFPIEKLITVLEGLNQKICEAMGSNDYELGTSFFMSDNLSEKIEDIWQMEVEPYLEEYFFDNQSREIIESFRWFNVQKQIY